MREIEFTNKLLGIRDNYTIRNTKEGIEVESDKKYFKERLVVEQFLISCIDIDSWNHSRHVDISSFTYSAETKAKVRKILQDKIQIRQEEIKTLEFAMKVLSRRKIKRSGEL